MTDTLIDMEEKLDMLGAGYLVFLFVLPPVLYFLPFWMLRWYSRIARFCLAVFVSGMGVQFYHYWIVQPMSLRLARASGDELSDGTGAGAVIAMVSLVVPTVMALLALTVEWLVQRRGEVGTRRALI